MSNVRSISTPSPAAALLAIGLLTAPVSPQLAQQFDQCAGEGDITPALRIDACSALIASNALDPINLAAAYDNRGNAYAAEHDSDHAIADYNRAIKIDPSYAAAYYNRGLARQRGGDSKAGAADIAKAEQIDPGITSR